MNNNQDPKPFVPFKPQNENNPNGSITTNVNQEELIAKAEDIITPKKSKTKIILTTLVTFLLLGSVAGAVFLVRQNQDVRKQATGECGDRSTGDCWGECRGTDEGEVCCEGPSQWSTWTLTKANSPSCGGTGDPATPTNPPTGDCVSEGASGCTSKSCCTGSNVCHNNVCTACGTIGDEGTCWTHSNCHWESGSCKDGATPTVTGSCKIDCGADRNGVSVTAQAGSETACNGAVVTATYFAKTCNSSTSCAGATTTTTGSLPFSASTVGNDCGYYQTDIVASTNKGGSCRDANAGPLGSCATATPTPTTPPGSTPTPTPAISCQCGQIKAYDTTWKLLTSADLAALKAGDKVRFTVIGTASSGTIDKSRFKINSGTYLESIIKKSATQEFYYEYTIPANVTSFSVEAQVHHAGLNQWF